MKTIKIFVKERRHCFFPDQKYKFDITDKKELVRCISTSTGPSSFGPTEKWDKLYFLDCRRFKLRIFKCYLINLSNKSTEWKAIKVNKTTTFGEQTKQGRRPRIGFKALKAQLHYKKEDSKIVKIFEGVIDELFSPTDEI